MGVLAAITAVIGFTSPVFAGFLGGVKGWPDLAMATVGTVFALAGIAVGWWVYGAKRVDTSALTARFPRLYEVLTNKFYFDLTYDRLIRDGFTALAGLLARFDLDVIDGVVNGAASAWSAVSTQLWRADVGIIDRAVDGVGTLVRSAGGRVRELQAGQVQGYQRLAYATLLILLVMALLSPLIGVLGAVVIASAMLVVAVLIVSRGA
jgi:NADH:ubiquinone oxidoreductase subunit 5 (subunit L)/multisubunit Na+/H+ antiporter MnhA subunit